MSDRITGNFAAIKAVELSPIARQRIAALLHVDLTDADELIVTLLRTVQTHADDRRVVARAKLLQFLNHLDDRSPEVDEAQMEAAIDEAMQFVRTRH